MATWLIMQQRVAITTREPLPRQLRRSFQRAGRPDPVVRTIDLRRTYRPDTDQADLSPGVAYRHQWPVAGHWHRYWYPSRGEHGLVYVATYIKGPKGAPMIGGERVNVLRR
jgi:hypothetical protein